MFNQILAIDVHQRIENFAERMKDVSQNLPLVLQQPAELGIAAARSIDAIAVSIYAELSVEFLEQFPKLKYVGVLGSSTKKIPLDYCAKKNIQVRSVVDYCDHETAEWVMLQVLKHFRERQNPQSCYEKSLGIIGAGAVGANVAKLALALGMRVSYFTPTERPELAALGAKAQSVEEIFANCHVISLHTPAHMTWLGAGQLAHLRDSALLINTCMGEISPPSEFADFLKKRPDVTLVMDAVAGMSYPSLEVQHFIDKNAAFLTPESQQRLQDKFFANFLTG